MRWYWTVMGTILMLAQLAYAWRGETGYALTCIALAIFCMAISNILDALRAPRETIVTIIHEHKDAA